MSDAHSVAELGVPGTMASDQLASGSRQSRQFERQHAVTELVISEGSVRIEDVAERFGVSLMTVHRDLDKLESRGILRKTRGVATATSTSVIESSDVYRSNRQAAEKEALAVAAMDYIEPGQAIILDDSTTVMRIARHLAGKAPITVITNTLTLMNELRDTNGITLLGLGGLYYNWCSAFMGPMTRHEIAQFHADTFIMSTSAIINDVVFHQYLETLDTKRAMFEASNKRVLLADHTKFERQALHAMVPLRAFDAVIVDDGTSRMDIERMRNTGINVVVAATPHTHRSTHAHRGTEERSK
jgi:DeoR/GlpR family transcriptional regulator of sugar metabolism